MGANFGRVSQTLSLNSTRMWYERAVQTAVTLRPIALDMLTDTSDNDDEKNEEDG